MAVEEYLSSDTAVWVYLTKMVGNHWRTVDLTSGTVPDVRHWWLRVQTSLHKHNFLSHKSSSKSFCRYTGHLANIQSATPTMSAFVNWGWPLTVNTPGWKPSPWRWCGPPAGTRGQLDPHVLPCQAPPRFMWGPKRSGLPCCPSGADPRSVAGLGPGVSLAPGPIKRPLKEGFRGRGYGV